MTVEMNIFTVSKQFNTENETEEVDLIQTLSEDYFKKEFIHESLQASQELEEQKEQLDSSGGDPSSTMPITHWISKIEPLEPLASKPLPSSSCPPILKRKPLPSNHKYAFLGDGESVPVVISSSLTSQ